MNLRQKLGRLIAGEKRDILSESAIVEIRRGLNEAGVPVAAFIDDHVGNAIVQRNQARAEVERLQNIGRRLLYHDERGQGAGWQQAMVELERALPSDSERDNG